MKKLLILNVLIFSGLNVFSQNLFNSNPHNQNDVSIQYSNNISNVQLQTNNRGNGSRSSAFSNFKQTNITQTQTAQLPKKKVVQVNKNAAVTTNKEVKVNVVNNVNLDNVPDNNVNDNVGSNPSVIQGNPQVQVNNQKKTVVNQPILVEESHGSDFKQIGLSGRDYSGGGKLKKGQKNFYKQETHKVKHKKRPGYKKVKYHTSKCASW